MELELGRRLSAQVLILVIFNSKQVYYELYEYELITENYEGLHIDNIY